MMTADQLLITWCREHRQGVPAGELTDLRVTREMVGVLLRDRMAELESRAHGPTAYRHDSLRGRVVPVEPAVLAPDPRADSLACSLATWAGYLDDALR